MLYWSLKRDGLRFRRRYILWRYLECVSLLKMPWQSLWQRVKGHWRGNLGFSIFQGRNKSYKKYLSLDLKYAYSWRINIQHRLVYEVFRKEKIVRILRMWTHYDWALREYWAQSVGLHQTDRVLYLEYIWRDPEYLALYRRHDWQALMLGFHTHPRHPCACL